jgi:PhnB protein
MASDGWIRTGYQSVNSYLVADSPDALIVWLCEVFACSERGVREIASDGRIGHAEIQLGDSIVMLSEASADHPARPSVNFVYVPDVDNVYQRAVTAGATKLHEPQDWPWGDRVAGFHDPADNRWWVATCLQNDPNSSDR